MPPAAGAMRAGRAAVAVACSLPLLWAVLAALDVAGLSLGANPVEALLHHFGLWGLNLLMVTLAVTPARRLSGALWLTAFRRMLGLFAFAYVSLHLSVYLVLDRELMAGEIWRDLTERPYITAGFGAFVLLLPLAITSTRGWRIRLGRHWQRLHRLVYVAAVLGVVHYLWLVKLDRGTPVIYGLVLATLLALRWLPARASRR